MKTNFRVLSTLILGGFIVLASCKKTKTEFTTYTVPDTYNFTNVDYSEATLRVNMWSGLTSYLSKGTARQLSQDTANYLWNNTNNGFTAETVVNLPYAFGDLNASSVNLSGKTTDDATIKKFIDSAVNVSASYAATGSEGVAGKIGTRLFNYTGLEFNQLVAKGLMGAFEMNEIVSLLNSVPSLDNNTVVTGQGTAMEHAWDLAFGYVSIPKANYVNRDVDTLFAFNNSDTKRPLAIGGYFRERGTFIKAGRKVYDAFIKGRAAIGAKDYTSRDQAIATIKEYLEKTLAAAAYEYSNKGKTDAAIQDRFHGLSEGYGFIIALKYRPAGSPLSDANYQNLLNIFKTSFYTLDAQSTHTQLNDAQTILTNAYGQLQP